MSGQGIAMGSERAQEYLNTKRNVLEKSINYSGMGTPKNKINLLERQTVTRETADISRY